jgi:flagellar motor switch protein FliM
MRDLLGQTKIGALLQFPQMRLRASDVAVLEPGTVLRLPLPKTSVAELRVGNLHLGRAHPVRTGEHRGAQLEGEFDGDVVGGHFAQALGKQADVVTMSVN